MDMDKVCMQNYATREEQLPMPSRNRNEVEMNSIIASGNVEETATPLHLACCEGHLPNMDMNKSCMQNYATTEEQLPMFSKNGNEEVKSIIPPGNVEETVTPLQFACSEGHVPIVDMNKDCMQNDVTKEEQLLMFSKNGNEEVKSIIESGVNVNIVDDTGRTALHYAALYGNVVVCKLLLDKLAEVNVGEDTVMPLHLACSEGHLPVVELLTTAGASIVSSAYDSYTPLHYAAENGHVEICKHLLNVGATAKCITYWLSTPLHLACKGGHSDVVNLLISRGAQVCFRTQHDETPLHCAAKFGHVATCKILLDTGANINAKDVWENTPLQLACEMEHPGVAKLLISYGAFVNTLDSKGETPLHIAATYGNVAICEYLLNAGANIDAVSNFSETPLHFACSEGHLPAVRLLVSRGASLEICNATKPILQHIKKYGHVDIIEFLENVLSKNK